MPYLLSKPKNNAHNLEDDFAPSPHPLSTVENACPCSYGDWVPLRRSLRIMSFI